ncbi:unnamed protein product, partial [Rotaria sordida]
MSSDTKSSTVQGEENDTTAGGTADIEAFDDEQINVNQIRAKTTLMRSKFLWRLINGKPNSEGGLYHIDRDPKKFECLMNYLVENHVPDILLCSVRDLYNASLFYGIDSPEDDCWGTTLSYTLENIKTYNIRGQLKSFADANNIFGWAKWKQRTLVDVEFDCYRTIDLNIVNDYMLDQASQQRFNIKSANQIDRRNQIHTMFECSKT